MALGIFYRSLVDVIKVLSIACADEAQGAPVYTESRRSVFGLACGFAIEKLIIWSRRPILQLWKGVLADLSALQSIFKYAYQHDSTIIGRVPPDVIEPRVAVQIYNRVHSVSWPLGFSVG